MCSAGVTTSVLPHALKNPTPKPHGIPYIPPKLESSKQPLVRDLGGQAAIRGRAWRVSGFRDVQLQVSGFWDVLLRCLGRVYGFI